MNIKFDDGDETFDAKTGVVVFHGRSDRGDHLFGCSKEALMDFARIDYASDKQLLGIFRANSHRIHEIARAKLVADAIENSGMCLVKTMDLNR